MGEKVALLIPNKSDKEIAEELRATFFVLLGPVADLITEAEKNGFEVGFSFSKDAGNNTYVKTVNLMKKF